MERHAKISQRSFKDTLSWLKFSRVFVIIAGSRACFKFTSLSKHWKKPSPKEIEEKKYELNR